MKTTPSSSVLAGLAGLLALACGTTSDAGPGASPAAAQAPEALEPAICGALEKVHELGGVYTAGQPTAEDLAAAREAGIRTVIDLRKPGEDRGYDEAAAAEALGLDYVTLPWNGPAELTDEVFERGRELLRTAERPLLFHCASANRCGALWIPYRVLDEGVPLDVAVAEAKTIGLKTPEYESKARAYVARERRP